MQCYMVHMMKQERLWQQWKNNSHTESITALTSFQEINWEKQKLNQECLWSVRNTLKNNPLACQDLIVFANTLSTLYMQPVVMNQ